MLGPLAAADDLVLRFAVEEFARLGEGSSESWWSVSRLKRLLGEALAIGYAAGPVLEEPRFAFLAMDGTPAYGGQARAVRRSVVVLKEEGQSPIGVSFDLVSFGEKPCVARWEMKGRPEGHVSVRTLSPAATKIAGGVGARDAAFLNVISLGPSTPAAYIDGVDVAGAEVTGWVVLFHTEPQVAQSALSFRVRGSEHRKFLLTGLAPGMWEIWHNGWLVEPQVVKRSFVLYFEGSAGDYFLRRLD